MAVRIIINGKARVYKGIPQQSPEVKTEEQLKKFDGVAYTEDVCSKYLNPNRFENVQIDGGNISCHYEAKKKQLGVRIEFVASRKLTDNELSDLVDGTLGQWSDGVGEANFWSEIDDDLTVDLSGNTRKTVQVEQLEDGAVKLTAASPLFKAVRDGELEKLRALLAEGHNPNVKDKEEFTPLGGAVVRKLEQHVTLLLEHGADPNITQGPRDIVSTPLIYAVNKENRAIVAELLKHCANANGVDHGGETALMVAAANDDAETIELLLRHGADVSLEDDVCQTALAHTRSESLREKLLRILEEQAGQGKAGPQLQLAKHLVSSEVEGPDPQRAFALCSRAAEQDHAQACMRLASWYYRQNSNAMSWYDQSAIVPVAKDDVAAFKWLKKAADLGDPMAATALGECYQEGIGTATDPSKAVEYFRIGAESGSWAGAIALAGCYESGNGVQLNLEEALSRYKTIAKSVPSSEVKATIKRLEKQLKPKKS